MLQQRQKRKFPIKWAISAFIIVWWGMGNIILFSCFLAGHKIYEPSALIASIELSLAVLGLLWFGQYLWIRKKAGNDNK